MNELPIQHHKWLKDDTIKVKLMKMSKGYQWEITYEGENDEAVLRRIKDMETNLRKEFSGECEA